jgi:fido (protein-threonine AMPylation protein)
MDQLIFKYEDISSRHIVERVSIFHLEFEAMHPFIDGNGRTGRLLINLELMKEGFPSSTSNLVTVSVITTALRVITQVAVTPLRWFLL